MSFWSKYQHHKRWKAVDTKSRQTSYPSQWTKHISTTITHLCSESMGAGYDISSVRKGHTENNERLLKACLHLRITVNFKDRAAHESTDIWITTTSDHSYHNLLHTTHSQFTNTTHGRDSTVLCSLCYTHTSWQEQYSTVLCSLCYRIHPNSK